EVAKREKEKFEVGSGSAPNIAEADLALLEARYLLARARAGTDPVSPDAPQPPPLANPAAAPRDDEDVAKTEAIKQALSQPIPMRFPDETPLEDVIKYIKTATQGPELPDGIPIYIDPKGLKKSEESESSPVKMNLEGVRLKTALRLLLNQVGLVYTVK